MFMDERDTPLTAVAEATRSYLPPPPPPPEKPNPAAGAAEPPRPVIRPAPAPAPADQPPAATAAAAPPAADGAAPVDPGTAIVVPKAASVGMSGGAMQKKRGRPRKYAPDGSVLNPMPISASVPAGEYPAASAAAAMKQAMKRGRARPANYVSKQQQRMEFESLGEMVSCSSGANFTPHVITVATGEIRRICQEKRSTCIL